MTSHAAVVVTQNRPADLDRLLGRLTAQTRRLDHIVVVDNGGLADTREAVARCPLATHLVSRRNLGGAGGFAFGILHALAAGADRVWIMDDDGYPETAECLAELDAALERDGYDMVSPLVLDVDDPEQLAFFYYRDGRPLKRRSEVGGGSFPQFAHLFNGALLRAETFERHGLPRYELFFRGDEVDFMFRLKRGGARFATLAGTCFLHPSGSRDAQAIMGGRYHAVIPASPFARYYFFRNRGTLYREFGLVRAPLYDLVRYGWAYLVTRGGDRAGLVDWFRTLRAGWRRDHAPYRAPRDPAGR